MFESFVNTFFFRTLVTVSLLLTVLSDSAFSQDEFESLFQRKLDSLSLPSPSISPKLYPNDALQGMMIPSGWGSSGTYIFASFGGVYPQLYTKRPDFVSAAGFGAGNASKSVSFAASVSISDVSKFNNFSANFSLSRTIGNASCISIGALQLFSDAVKTDAPEATFYLAFSHSVQSLPSKTPGLSKLTFTAGIGTGRFMLKSPMDIVKGKGKYGTAVFGGVSYELLRGLNINTEWDGLNLGSSLGYRPGKLPLSVGFGVTNLTKYSGDKPFVVACIGYSISLTPKSKSIL